MQTSLKQWIGKQDGYHATGIFGERLKGEKRPQKYTVRLSPSQFKVRNRRKSIGISQALSNRGTLSKFRIC